MTATKRKAVIRIDGNWCDGYWWQIVGSDTGRTIKESGPYYLMADAKQVAYEDAEDYARNNDIDIIRYA